MADKNYHIAAAGCQGPSRGTGRELRNMGTVAGQQMRQDGRRVADHVLLQLAVGADAGLNPPEGFLVIAGAIGFDGTGEAVVRRRASAIDLVRPGLDDECQALPGRDRIGVLPHPVNRIRKRRLCRNRRQQLHEKRPDQQARDHATGVCNSQLHRFEP